LVTTEFDSWDQAIEAAGVDSFGPDRQALIQELQRLDAEVEVMKATVLPKHSEYSQHQFVEEFGSWAEALSAAGIDREDRFLEDLQAVAARLGASPNQHQYTNHGKYSATMLADAFGSWQNALEQAELGGGPSRQELIDELQRLDESHDVIKPTVLKQNSHYTVPDFIQEFGTWKDALTAADLDRAHTFCADLQRVAAEVGTLPDKFQYTNHGHYSHTDIVDEFGTWERALAAVKEADADGTEITSSTDAENTDVESTDGAAADDPTASEESTSRGVLQRMEEEFTEDASG
jgi:hypothetical protein